VISPAFHSPDRTTKAPQRRESGQVAAAGTRTHLATTELLRSPPTSSAGVGQHEGEILRRRREHMILRVDRADLSKNVLRGFTAFDIFLEQHPEFRENVTFIAHLQPSRQDVPEYVEYLEKIEALVAVINHRHGTTDWMPIDLKIYENFHEALARYKHFDLLMVNSIFDGMNLVAKEFVAARDDQKGVLVLSQFTGAARQLRAALLVNPADIDSSADVLVTALGMSMAEQSRRMRLLRDNVATFDASWWARQLIQDAVRANQRTYSVEQQLSA